MYCAICICKTCLVGARSAPPKFSIDPRANAFYLIQWHYSSPSPAHAEEASI